MPLQQPPQFDRRHLKFVPSDGDNWTDNAMSNHHSQQQQQVENKRRETGWNTSFPAEYVKSNVQRDFQQTLAFQEQLNRQQSQDEAMSGKNPPTLGHIESRSTAGDGRYRASATESNCGSYSQSNEELALLKDVTMREGLVTKLIELVKFATQEQDFGVDRGTELLHLLLQLRDASVQVMHATSNWHASLRSGPIAFCFENKNYCLKMVSDLNFLAKTKSLGKILGVNPAKMKQNPFMMPAPIPERDFHATQNLTWSRVVRRFSTDPVERVADAEKYLVWCLFHLADPVCPAQSGSSPTASAMSSYPEKSSGTWQQRAEKQLQMLSMPLEAPTGQMHIMDSSKMMKRKGYLPSLPLSPPKTLTDLIDTVHPTQQPPFEKRLNSLLYLRAYWKEIEFSTSSKELEALGAMETPPHHMVTLVAASVLILLSPSDRIPKDLSWPSCRKMLLSGAKLVDRMARFEVGSVPAFKWKALVPFLENEHFQPKFLHEFSPAAGVLCAWVFASLASAQNQEFATTRSDEDRLDLLGELEIEDGFEELQSSLQPAFPSEEARPKSKNSKRVTIGNAEVLFINENQPVSSSPRPPSGGETPLAKKKSSVLVRTSPWTFHGVTYFVSFFLEHDETVFSIKLYEPMSSVESQIFVTEDDFNVDFGPTAFEYFRTRNFRPLCDLILSRLDGMMTESKHSVQELPARVRPPTDLAGEYGAELESIADEPAPQTMSDILDLVEEDEEQEEGVYEGVNGSDERGDPGESALRIQCAARQRLARDRVKQARIQKRNEHALRRAESATKIQSLTRQTLAKKEVARMRLEHRRPTGIPTSAMLFEEEAEDVRGSDELGRLKISEEDEEGEEGASQDQEALPPPIGHFGTAGDHGEAADDHGDADKDGEAERPETVMSYASEQFEDDFEDE